MTADGWVWTTLGLLLVLLGVRAWVVETGRTRPGRTPVRVTVLTVACLAAAALVSGLTTANGGALLVWLVAHPKEAKAMQDAAQDAQDAAQEAAADAAAGGAPPAPAPPPVTSSPPTASAAPRVVEAPRPRPTSRVVRPPAARPTAAPTAAAPSTATGAGASAAGRATSAPSSSEKRGDG